MAQKFSPGLKSTGTESLIQKAYLAASSRRITINSLFLDDEKLPESERVAVLNEVFHRNIRSKQLERMANILSPILGGQCPTNLLIFGPSGTGKSVTCLHFLSSLSSMCLKKGMEFGYFYVDLTTPRTCFGALNELAIALDGRTRRYRKGIALGQMQETVIRALSQIQGLTGIVIDEVDNITVDSDVFYTFLAKTLPKKVNTRLFYVFLTNRIEWEKTLDPRILSVLKKTDMIFEPYDAVDLVEILNLRVEKALNEQKVDPGAIRKIAAYASRETGDARRAVELLVKAVKIAEDTTGYLSEKEVDEADRILEIDKTTELIKSLAVQQKVTLEACYASLSNSSKKLSTGQVYELYRTMCDHQHIRALTQRRFSDMISFLDLYGLINARVVSKGRYGKTREISASLPPKVIERLMQEHLV